MFRRKHAVRMEKNTKRHSKKLIPKRKHQQQLYSQIKLPIKAQKANFKRTMWWWFLFLWSWWRQDREWGIFWFASHKSINLLNQWNHSLNIPALILMAALFRRIVSYRPLLFTRSRHFWIHLFSWNWSQVYNWAEMGDHPIKRCPIHPMNHRSLEIWQIDIIPQLQTQTQGPSHRRNLTSPQTPQYCNAYSLVAVDTGGHTLAGRYALRNESCLSRSGRFVCLLMHCGSFFSGSNRSYPCNGPLGKPTTQWKRQHRRLTGETEQEQRVLRTCHASNQPDSDGA